MAIAYDTSGYQTGDSVSSRTVSLAATGSDRVAVMTISWLSGSYDSPTVTVNGSGTGVAQFGSMLQHPNNGNKKAAMFRCIAPPTSAVDYVATWGGNVGNVMLAIATYTGVDQTTPLTGSLTTATGVSTAPSVTVSSATGEVVVGAGVSWYPGGDTSFTADGGQNSRVLQSGWLGNGDAHGLSDKAGAASVALTWTLGNSADWSSIGARLAEASSGSIVPQAMAQYINQVIQ